MKMAIMLVAMILMASCAQTREFVADIKRVATRDANDLKKSCDHENDARSCVRYGQWLRDNGDDNYTRMSFYEKSCKLGNAEGCEMSKLVVTQKNDQARTIKEQEIQNARWMRETARLEKEYALKMKESERLEKIAAARINKCVNGDNKICLRLSSENYQAGNLDEAIRLANFACANSSTAGCNLQANYILERNGREMTRQQEIANQQAQSIENNRVIAEENRLENERLEAIAKRVRDSYSAKPVKKTKCESVRDYRGNYTTECKEAGY